MKTQKLKPTPKWYFTLKGVLIGIIFFLSLFLGGLAFSVVLFAVQQLGFDLITHMSHSGIEFFLGLLPFLWIALLIVFLILSMFSFKKSEKGYKFTPGRLFIYNATLSILLGTIFFLGGGGQWIENTFALNVEVYESVNEKKINVWSKPEEGMLSGSITAVYEDSLEIVDFNTKQWIIDYSQANIPHSVLLEEGEVIKIRGELSSTSHFHADEIRPWGGKNRINRKKTKP